jgi:hypothetical protein
VRAVHSEASSWGTVTCHSLKTQDGYESTMNHAIRDYNSKYGSLQKTNTGLVTLGLSAKKMYYVTIGTEWTRREKQIK